MSIAGVNRGYTYQGEPYQTKTKNKTTSIYQKIIENAAQTTNQNTKHTQDSDTAAEQTTEAAENEKTARLSTAELLEKMQNKMQEMFTKIENGDTEETYQIGSQSFTEKEWNQFLKKFDSLEEAIQEMMKAEQEQRMKEAEKQELLEKAADTGAANDTVNDAINNAIAEALVSESTTCTYPAEEKGQVSKMYITWYTEAGIYCREQGQTEGYLWSMQFDENAQYEKVMTFLNRFDSDANLTFASHQNFWEDLMAGKINEEDFERFFEETNDGIPNYSITKGDSVYVDKEKAKYAPYMNPLGSEMLTGAEMEKKMMAAMKQ